MNFDLNWSVNEKMDVEKKASKGGFLQLFDWNVKSRKKLLSNKSELPEGSKQGKENFANSVTLHPQLMEMCENGPVPRDKRGDCNFASSVASDEAYGTRAPCVVARLMGLDSLPDPNISESCSTPFCDSPSVRDSCSQRSTSNFQNKPPIVSNRPNDRISRDPVESRWQTGHKRSINRFQIETLPPKTAKSIPITHYRLLSPIKSPGSIPLNNASYIMEAASKIIDQGPSSAAKGKMPCFGSSSVPSRIRDLKEKMEAAHKASGLPEASRRPKEPISFKYNNKGKISKKNPDGSGDARFYNASVGSVKDSLKKKGKPVSLAVKAKSNVERREGLISRGNKSSFNRKEVDVIKPDQFNKSQVNMQKSVQKRTSNVLNLNNQKQNFVANKDRIVSKASLSNPQDRKASSITGFVRPDKASKKVINSATGFRKMNSVAKNTGKHLPSSRTKTSSEKKQPVHGDIHFEESAAKKILIGNDERSVKCNIGHDGCSNWEVDRKNNVDVVSFTFTSPIKKAAPGSQSSGQDVESNNCSCVNSCDDDDPCDLKIPTQSSLGLNLIGGDALSVLLEQKLKELTCRFESTHCNLIESGGAACSTFSLQDFPSNPNVIDTTSVQHHDILQFKLHKDKSSQPYDIDCASVDGLLLKANQKWQGLEEIEGQSSGSSCNFDHQYPSPISNLEPSSSNGSCNSSESQINSITVGYEQCHLAEAHETADCASARKCQPMEVDTELSDSASSASVASMGGEDSSAAFSSIDLKKTSNWELEYMTNILCNSESFIEDFALGQFSKLMTAHLFDQLEIPKTRLDANAEEHFKLGPKLLFDCMRECLELKCEQQLLGGSCKTWSKWLFKRKGRWLAEELHKEISSWTSTGGLMVDELVDKDMSSWHGNWVNFEFEASEEGVEIEKGILTSLVDDLVADLI